MSQPLPAAFRAFQEQYPDIYAAYEQLGAAVHSAGPLDSKTRDLIKLALAVGLRAEGAVHAHTRKALEAGIAPAEIRQTVLLALPTLGFPSTMAALTWVEDILSRHE
jgi:4-carboxymuconolactone decarboxylase